jgi:hypothetical protein
MTRLLELVQLLLYVPMLALAGQGALHLLSGARRESNAFYRALRVVAWPVTAPLRRLLPRAADRLAAPLAFALLLALSLIVFAERGYQLCVQMGLQDCRR